MEAVSRNRYLMMFLALVFACVTTLAVTLTPAPEPVGSSSALAGKTCSNTHHHHFDGQYTIHHWRYNVEPAGNNNTKWFWKKARNRGNDYSDHSGAEKIGYILC